jgi:pimeloyl-ACP methyl ester carboxylesterase
MSRSTTAAAAFAILAITHFLAGPADGVDYVILKDGTILTGKYFKERATIKDSKGNGIFQVDKANGLEGIDTGPKTICFGSIGAQVGESGTDTVQQAPYVRYERRIPAAGYLPLPGGLQLSSLDFDDEWKARFRVNTGNGNWQEIKLHLTSFDPTTAFIVSSTHRWQLCFDTKELGPDYARKLLVSHPDLVEKTGPDPLKRIAIARFFRDAGWLDAAKAELAKAKKEIPGEWPVKALERLDELNALIDRSISQTLAGDMEKAVAAGRFTEAYRKFEKFKPEHADAKDATRVANLKSAVDAVFPRYEQTKVRLAGVIDRLAGSPSAVRAAVGGWAAIAPSKANTNATLLVAGQAVLADLHPDTAGRLDLFFDLAGQADDARRAGKAVATTDEALLALAVTGFLKGKNGASAEVAGAIRCWTIRQMVMAYLATEYATDRVKILNDYRKAEPAPFDEIAQVISLLPPSHPVDPEKPGKPIAHQPGTFIQNTGQLTEKASGVDYVLRLPTEYHHGRAYPLVIALGPGNNAPEQTMARILAEADRHGYIVACPNWAHIQAKGTYDFSGDGHYVVTGVLRDVVRKVNIDPDRVMLFGIADGGTFALDVACGHPDHFAGLATFGSYPKPDIFMDYWSNLQKVPQYAVTGQLAGEPLKQTYNMFTKLLKAGFPSLFIVYKGRAIEHYSAEVEPMFEWFQRRRRPPTATIVKPLPGQANVSGGARFDWVTMRPTDNRFYWIQCDQIAPNYLMKPPKGLFPASINPDIKADKNLVVVNTRGVRQFTVFFERDMIDWTKPVDVSVNGNKPQGFKAKVLEPDLSVMLDEFRRSGDRKRLFLQKMTLTGF